MASEQRDIDEIIVRVMQDLPIARLGQVKVMHLPDDGDCIWYFSLPGLEPEIQIESSLGTCPFPVETR